MQMKAGSSCVNIIKFTAFILSVYAFEDSGGGQVRCLISLDNATGISSLKTRPPAGPGRQISLFILITALFCFVFVDAQ